MKHILMQGLLWAFALSTYSQTGPGGVSANLRLWLKANQGTSTTTNGATVTTWTDADAAPNNPTIVNSPTYSSANSPFFNYNPSVSFNGASMTHTNLCSGMISGDLFYVLRCASTTASSPLQELHNFNGDGGIGSTFPYTDGMLYDDFGANGLPFLEVFLKSCTPTNTINLPFIYNSCNGGSGVARNSNVYVNGLRMFALTEALSTPSYSLTTTFFKGDYAEAPTVPLVNNCAEIVLYAAELTAAQRQSVVSYLAMKYGITLNQSVAYNYTASDATVVWDGTANSTYRNNIIGIGRDDAAAVLQKQSRSINTASNGNILSINIGTLTTTNAANTGTVTNDKSFFYCSDNLLAVTSVSTVTKPPGIFTRIQRIWKNQATNFTQNVTVGFESGLLVGSSPIANLRLLTDDDGNFANATVESATAVLNGTRIEFQNIAGLGTAAKRYFSLGSTSAATPLPVELLYFRSICTNGFVKLDWATASEMNHHFFAIERSDDGMSFVELIRINGTGAFGATYSYTDRAGDAARYYYRLRQTDKDGSFGYSDLIARESCGTLQSALRIYPNPLTDEEDLHWEITGSPEGPVFLEIFDVYGKLCDKMEIVFGAERAGSFQLRDLGKGVYFVRTSGLSNDQVFKLLKN